MKHTFLTLIIACALSIQLNAQTPFDSFAPEVTRPMLELEESTNTTSDSILCAIVADVQNQMLLLVDVSNAQIVSSAPITDDIRKWLSVDPLSDKYPGISPYAYAAWNPVKYVDPDGNFVNVVDNLDGTYTTYSGEIDNDFQVYVVNSAGERTGEVIGQTLTPYSFFGNENQFIEGATINMADASGQEFLNQVINDYPNPYLYAAQALPNGSRDFKNIGYIKGMDKTTHHYRAMTINTFDGNGPRIATARDIGNYGAGFVAGSNGVTWDMTRKMFDLVQGHLILFQSEPMVSQCAQYAGYEHGYQVLGRFLGTK